MSINLDKLLVTKEDFSDFRDLSSNIKEGRVNIFIRESQLIEIRAFLGSGLYNLLLADYDELLKTFTDPRFTDLWFGGLYTNYAGVEINFNGYASGLVYFAYARFLHQQQVNVSRFGVESVQSDISEDISNPQVRNKAKDALQVALQYQKDTFKFLEANKDTYPEYDLNCSNEKGKKNSFPFFILK